MDVKEGLPLVCMVTHPPEGAEAFARLLIEERAAACVNRLPATSTYRWEGKLHEDGEVLLLVKTSQARLGLLRRLLENHHPYDVPELIALRPEAVGEAYRDWWLAELAPPQSKSGAKPTGSASDSDGSQAGA